MIDLPNLRDYQKWIDANASEARGKCAEVTKAMHERFPELNRVRGYYYCFAWGKRAHWWLVDARGNVIDPTASQFPSKGNGEYMPWDETQAEPTGRCFNCGEFCYNNETCCSESCGIEYVEFCTGRRRER
jgi:hypothetical protein